MPARKGTAAPPLLADLRSRRWFLTGVACLFVSDLATFADVLFQTGAQVLSAPGTDTYTQYIYWRQFGFDELRAGNLPLWNPYVAGGLPFFGGFQSALLYPPNWVHLIFPIHVAVNLTVAIHVFLMGLFTYVWAWHRGLCMPACLLAGVMLMFGGPYFLHVYPGHLSNLSAMPWAPLILLSMDGVFESRRVGWVLLGIGAIAMLILAGHPQYVFYTAVACAVYAAVNLIDVEKRLRVLGMLGCMALGALLLASVQLLTGIAASSQSVRSGGVPFEFASIFSFPPENVFTFLVPPFFGDLGRTIGTSTYWGRCYLWEMSLFVSVTGIVLAGYGAACGEKPLRRFSVWMVMILFVLALGSHTPLFRLLYDYVPGFDRFRGNSKFVFPMTLFVAMLAAVGLDQLLRAASSRRLAWAAAALALALAILAIAIRATIPRMQLDGWWHDLMLAIHATGEIFVTRQRYFDLAFATDAALIAVQGLWVAVGTLIAIVGCLSLMRRYRGAAHLLVVLAALEVFLYARTHRPTFDLEALPVAALDEFYRQNPGDYRVLNRLEGNVAMATRVGDIWGHDPGVLRRYAEFMTATQGGDPGHATQYVKFTTPEPLDRLYGMLRLKYLFTLTGDAVHVTTMSSPMQRLHLIDDVRVIEGRDAILRNLQLRQFDPRRSVILEQPPDPAPEASCGGTAGVVDASTDHLTIEADVTAPCLLLVTDGYSPDWYVEALSGSAQDDYEVLPANYVLRAIPLHSGHHELRLEYRPAAFAVGAWISATALIAYVVALAVWALRFVRSGASPGLARRSLTGQIRDPSKHINEDR